LVSADFSNTLWRLQFCFRVIHKPMFLHWL
jgi:hypothetical protein